MKKNIAYLRVSKREENLDNQRNAIREFAKEDLMFFEDTISGSVPAMQRKAFVDLFDYVEK
ncbi:MAG: recombinase family protein, partial [Thermoplasmata archaeon]